MPRRKEPSPPPPAKHVVLEGYADSVEAVLRNLYLREAPSQFNCLTVTRVRVTVELIEEPPEVLGQRLIELLETSEPNYHFFDAYRDLATKYGVTLDWSRQGIRYKKR